jgi:hypothetical protein
VGRCASCGTDVLWLRSWGFGEPRPLELDPAPDGEVFIDPLEARHRAVAANGIALDGRHRYRLHWPCPPLAPAPAPAAVEPVAPVPERPVSLPVAVVPHTHWDREWYSPFQTFRLRLVRMVDGLLDLLERDPSFAHFLLDGQMAMVDDYLEVRPEAEDRVRRLALAGRLALGPWHTQPDEFLVSGETLVRNLQVGLARAGALGGAMEVGYLPDSFGHTAQMPQILHRAGIGHAVVFRGLPRAVAASGFWWVAPDGSRVRAEHLPFGYTNAYRLADDPQALVARARDFEAALGDRRRGGLLLMNGGDHEAPRPWLPGVVAGANEVQEAYRFVVCGLEEFLAGQPVEGLPAWQGELRSSGPSTVTMGVTSNRVDVRLAAAAAERAVERRGEVLSALFLPGARYPRRLLDLAWRRLVENAAHDSVCACSADEVVDQVLLRYAEARQVGEGLAAEAVAAVAGAVAAPAGSLVAVNPSSHRRSGAVRVEIPGVGPCHLVGPDGRRWPAQVLGVAEERELVAEEVGAAMGFALDLFGPGTFAGHPVAGWSAAADGSAELHLRMAVPGQERADLSGARAWLEGWCRAHPDERVRVVLLRAPVRDVLARCGEVEGFGWAAFEVVEGEGPATAVCGADGWIANERVRVAVDAATGTLSVETAGGLRAEGLNRYADGGDAGDTYNWSPPVGGVVDDRPSSVSVALVESGPVRARLRVVAQYRWADVETLVDVVAGEPLVRVWVGFENRRRDHRLRVHFPLPAVVGGSAAEAAFAVVERGLHHEGNPIEAPLPTYPSFRFVDCSDGRVGLALVHDGVGEYEVVGDGRELAFTVLRSVGRLSRDDGQLRPVGAGPPVVLERAQQQGPFRRRYAVAVHEGGWEEAGLHRLADDVLLPLETAWVATSGGTFPPAGSRLSVEGVEVTAVLREQGALVVRLLRAAATPGTAVLGHGLDGTPAEGWTVDLRGRPLAPVRGRLDLGPWELATVRLAPDAEPARS